jgi:SecD/SecF fusion protein
MWAIVVASIVLINAAIAQDTKTDGKADEKAVAAESEAKVTAEAPSAKGNEKAAAPATDAKADAPVSTTSDPAATTPPAMTQTPGEATATGDSQPPAGTAADSQTKDATAAAGTTTGEVAGSDFAWLRTLAILVALFVLPVIVGNYLAKVWRMPDHAWKISLTLFILAGSLFVCVAAWQHWMRLQFKFGPDLAGGSTLIYELQDAPETIVDPDEPQDSAKKDDSQQLKSGGREFTMSKLIDSLKRRLDPDGTKEITIRAYGSAVEIIIPQVGPDEMEFVKEKITKMGQLEFRITADPNLPKDKPYIDAAKLVPPTKQEVRINDQLKAKWVPYDLNEFGQVDQPDGFVKRSAGDIPEILVLIDTFNVTGDYLTSATKGIDEHGNPAVHFAFNSAGAQRFERLTGQNTPNPATPDVFRRLGILLDGRLVNAPTIRTKISDRGMISGGSMSERDVELNVQVLDAGSLPAALNKTPISQEIISPTLGGQTVQEGKRAITASLIGVALFMIGYYRIAGIVACLALALNILMVLALMVLIKAAFTLPGLAGLALTVGMSVDANVLIYERIREELERGAALRMAIRNGFSKALSAIVDSNLTTIISGIVLFYIGTDQVKGFAVTLVLGILASMFSAIFFARLVFDVAERQGWIKNLRMMRLFAKPNIDFLRWRWVTLATSWVLIGIGLIAAYTRGAHLFDIDFTGGSSVTFTLNDSDKMGLGAVRDALAETNLQEKNLLVVERGKTGTNFTVDTSEQSVDIVKGVIDKVFGEKLKKYSLEFSDVKAVTDGDFTGTEATLRVNAGENYKGEEGMSHDALRDQIALAVGQAGHPSARVTLTNPGYRGGSAVPFSEWTMRISGLDEAATKAVLESMQTTLHAKPLFPLANTIGSRVSSNMKFQAILATLLSLVAMVIYLWLRFQKPAYGIAAGVALLHDVMVTVGMIALSYYVVEAVPVLAHALRIESFQINLTIVAALLTIIGFSVNDTIVTFDRLREIKGKSPQLTANMVNESVNQTLSRTLLTVTTVFIVVIVLYIYGGAGLHSFAFAFLVGIMVGTYSTIYIAAPVLLWLSGVSAATQPEAPAASTPRGMQPAR